MIRCATVSNSDVNKVDWQEFEKLHALFESFTPIFTSSWNWTKWGRPVSNSI